MHAKWYRYATFCALAGVDQTDFRAAAAQLPSIDSIDLSKLILGNLAKDAIRPRMELPIGAGPRQSNLSTAPPCASYSGSMLYDDSEGQVQSDTLGTRAW